MPYDARPKEQDNENPYTALAHDAPASPSPGGGPAPMAAPKPGGSGHINFSQIANANQGVSQREAGKMQSAADQRGQAARTGITGATATFNQNARTGTATGPNAAQQNFAQYGTTGVVQPKIIRDATANNVTSPAPNTVTETGQGLRDAPAEPVAQPDNVGFENVSGMKWSGVPGRSLDRHIETPEEFRKEIAAGVAQEYSGPNALSDLDIYAKLAQDVASAQDQTSAMASGNEGIQAQGLNQLDAALVGGAGRKGFSDLGRRYAGLKGELEKANTDSTAIANEAKGRSVSAIDAYKSLLGDYEGRVASDTAAAEQANAANAEFGPVTPVEGDGWTKDDGQAIPQETVDFVMNKGVPLETARKQAQGSFGTLGADESLPVQWAGVSPNFNKQSMKKLLGVITEVDWKNYQDALKYGRKTLEKWLTKMLAKYKI